jgi:hypothetical protein
MTTPSSPRSERFSITPSVIALVITVALTAPFALSKDLGLFLVYLFFFLPALIAAGVILAIVALCQKGKPRLATLAALAVLIAAHVGTAWIGWEYRDDLNDRIRWSLFSGYYKDRVRNSPGPGAGLPHIEWDTWGMAGLESFAYLVYDASDTMLPPPYHSREGKVAGVPCDVARIHRLEARWYIVMPYTDSDWDQCDDN